MLIPQWLSQEVATVDTETDGDKDDDDSDVYTPEIITCRGPPGIVKPDSKHTTSSDGDDGPTGKPGEDKQTTVEKSTTDIGKLGVPVESNSAETDSGN